MAYINCLNDIELGQEATLGTADTLDIRPTAVTNVTISPKVEVEKLEDKRASTMTTKYSFVKRRWSEGTIEGYVNYNSFMYFLDGMFGVDATSPHAYEADEDAAVTPKSMTMAIGQTGLIYQVAGIVPRNLKISGDSGSAWKYSYEWFGKPVTDGASFAGASDVTVGLAHGYETEIYIEPDLTTAAGTTIRNDVGFSFEADITANHEPVFHLGNQTWDGVRQGKWDGSLHLVLEADATNLAWLGDIIDATDTAQGFTVRFRVTDGSDTLDLDFAGVCVEPPELITDEDGVVTIDLNLEAAYNSTDDTCWAATLTIGA